jgi:hypothetical protein
MEQRHFPPFERGIRAGIDQFNGFKYSIPKTQAPVAGGNDGRFGGNQVTIIKQPVVHGVKLVKGVKWVKEVKAVIKKRIYKKSPFQNTGTDFTDILTDEMN